MNERTIRIIFGPTASGKAMLASRIAKFLDADIISLDSMKVYKRLDIGTAKPSSEEQRNVKYHQIDICEPNQTYTVADYIQSSLEISAGMQKKGKPVLFSGGTALYYKGLTEGIFKGPRSNEKLRDRLRMEAESKGTPALHARLAQVDPIAAARILQNDLRRIIRALEVFELSGKTITELQKQFGSRREGYRFLVLAIIPERELCYRRCDSRVDRMLASGLVEEARGIFEDYPVLGSGPRQAVGYKELFAHFRGEISFEEAVERIKLDTRHLARRQYMWLRRFTGIHRIERTEADTTETLFEKARSEYREFFEF